HRADSNRMSQAPPRLGFDRDLEHVSDVSSGHSSIICVLCYGTDTGAVATSIGPVVDGIHAAHMLSAAKHFPGHGNTAVTSETQLPRIDESLATVKARDLPPFQAAVTHGTDFVLLGHLFFPALDAQRSAALSPSTMTLLRADLGF